ncbi:FACT complex subunit SSRP1-like [Pteropus medius]|uniref:FACT complex subunit SSRP1-like n=1 Tax=Pteropus vampyrus TaxID=132908 RepID=UPI00196A351C|nr:FACT complex subunit SSRP1-like [Pteropus giganteus]
MAKDRKSRKKRIEVKKGKDPNAPKRSMPAYMLWLNVSREKIKSDHPGISIMDLSKKAGEIWKGMSKEKKKKWDRKAEDARGEYEKAMKKYERGQGEYSKREKSKRKVKVKIEKKVNTC